MSDIELFSMLLAIKELLDEDNKCAAKDLLGKAIEIARKKITDEDLDAAYMASESW